MYRGNLDPKLLEHTDPIRRATALFEAFTRIGALPATNGYVAIGYEYPDPGLAEPIARVAKTDSNAFVRFAALDRLKNILLTDSLAHPLLMAVVQRAVEGMLSCIGCPDHVIVPSRFTDSRQTPATFYFEEGSLGPGRTLGHLDTLAEAELTEAFAVIRNASKTTLLIKVLRRAIHAAGTPVDPAGPALWRVFSALLDQTPLRVVARLKSAGSGRPGFPVPGPRPAVGPATVVLRKARA